MKFNQHTKQGPDDGEGSEMGGGAAMSFVNEHMASKEKSEDSTSSITLEALAASQAQTQETLGTLSSSLGQLAELFKGSQGQAAQTKDSMGEALKSISDQQATLNSILAPRQNTDPLDGVLDEAGREKYKDSLPVITALAEKIAESKVSSMESTFNQRLAEMQNSTNQSVESLKQQSEQRASAEFRRQMNARYPQLTTQLKGDEWGKFGARKVPFSNLTFSESFYKKVEDGNLDGATEIFDAFQKEFNVTNNNGNANYFAEPGNSGGVHTMETTPSNNTFTPDRLARVEAEILKGTLDPKQLEAAKQWMNDYHDYERQKGQK